MCTPAPLEPKIQKSTNLFPNQNLALELERLSQMNPHLAGSWAGGDWGEQDIGEDGSPPLSHYQLPGQPIQNDFILSLNVRSFTAGSKT